MTPEQFCYWLQGRAEMQPDTSPSDAEWKMIREHLATVFVKVTPPLYSPMPMFPGPLTDQGWRPAYTVECSARAPDTGAVAIC